MIILSFSGKDLATKSAMQLCYMRKHRVIVNPNPNQLVGVEHQHNVANKQGTNGIYEEMKTSFQYDNIVINCCHDIVDKKKKIVTEVKMVDPNRPIEQWYLQSSIVQCVLYSTICHFNGNLFNTPQFRIRQGYKQDGFYLSKLEYHLLFGDKEYLITVNDYDKVLSYFLIKANCSSNYNMAKQYDSIHEFQHFKDLEQYFDCQLIKNIKI